MTKVVEQTTIMNADDIVDILNFEDEGTSAPSQLLHNNNNKNKDTSLDDDDNEDLDREHSDDIFSRLELLNEELTDIMAEGIQMRHLPDVPVANPESNEIFFKLENLVTELQDIMVEGIKMDHIS